jgi:hypothetical protein
VPTAAVPAEEGEEAAAAASRSRRGRRSRAWRPRLPREQRSLGRSRRGGRTLPAERSSARNPRHGARPFARGSPARAARTEAFDLAARVLAGTARPRRSLPTWTTASPIEREARSPACRSRVRRRCLRQGGRRRCGLGWGTAITPARATGPDRDTAAAVAGPDERERAAERRSAGANETREGSRHGFEDAVESASPRDDLPD